LQTALKTPAFKPSLIFKQPAVNALSVGYNRKHIEESVNTKFLSLQTEIHLNCKTDTDQIILKLSGVCYTFRSMFHAVTTDTLKSVYLAYFHSVIAYRIIFAVTTLRGNGYLLYKRKTLEL
jgi:hypothetical protein